MKFNIDLKKLHPGKKTYLAAIALAVVTFVRVMGWIDQELYEILLGFLGTFGLASLRAANSKTDKTVKTAGRLLAIAVLKKKLKEGLKDGI